MSTIVAWEVKLGELTTGVRVVAPEDASLDEIAAAGRLAILDRDVSEARPEFATHDEERAHHLASLREVASVTRLPELYVAHPRLGEG